MAIYEGGDYPYRNLLISAHKRIEDVRMATKKVEGLKHKIRKFIYNVEIGYYEHDNVILRDILKKYNISKHVGVFMCSELKEKCGFILCVNPVSVSHIMECLSFLIYGGTLTIKFTSVPEGTIINFVILLHHSFEDIIVYNSNYSTYPIIILKSWKNTEMKNTTSLNEIQSIMLRWIKYLEEIWYREKNIENIINVVGDDEEVVRVEFFLRSIGLHVS